MQNFDDVQKARLNFQPDFSAQLVFSKGP